MINNSLKAFKAEWLKLKGSGMLWIVLIMSLFLPLIFTIAVMLSSSEFKDTSVNQWGSFVENCYGAFASFFYPIFLILVVVRLCQIEHRNGGWKLIETQPIHRFHLYIAKFKIALLVSLVCLFMVCIFALLGATIYSFTKNGAVLKTQPIPFSVIISYTLRLWIAGFGLMALQYFLSVLIPNFALPFIIGFVATIVASISAQFDVLNWLPYSAPSFTSKVYNGSITGNWLLHHEKLSIAFMLLFLFIGYQYFYYKNIVAAYFKPFTQILKLFAACIIFAVLFWFIEKPIVLKPYTHTVVAGYFETKDTIKGNVVLQNLANYDTVAIAPIFRNNFNFTCNKNLPLGEYMLSANKYRFKVIIGNNDSLHAKITVTKFKKDAKFSGTRVAENELYATAFGQNNFDMDEYYINKNMQEFKPKEYGEKVLEQIKKANKKIDAFKTTDNIKPANDFIVMLKKLKALSYYNLLKIEYPKSFALYHPNEKIDYPSSVEAFAKNIVLNDTSLLNFETYRTFIGASYRKNAGVRSNSYDTTLFNYIIKNAKHSSIKNTLLRTELSEAISNIRDSVFRNFIVTKYIKQVDNIEAQQELYKKNIIQNSFQRGKPAPFFITETILSDTTTILNYRGRYMVIDVWATWCGPCKYESPYYEDMAEKYTSDKLGFISISVDEEKNEWKMEVPEKSKAVIQLWALNKDAFMANYGIEGIPRFMLIDPNGKIISINLARPSEAEFETMLQREVMNK